MNTRRTQITLASLGAAAVALMALAMGVGELTLQPGRPVSFGGETGGGGGGASAGLNPMLLLVTFIWVCLIATVVAAVVSRSLRRYILQSLPLYLIYGLLMYLLLSWLFSAAQPAIEEAADVPRAAEAAPQPQLPEAPAPITPPDYVTSPPQWLSLGVSLAVGLAVVAAIWLLVRRVRQRAAEPESALAQIAREAESALAGIAGGEGLRNAVLRCYAEMSRVLADERGVSRDVTMTPREFEQRLAASGVRDEHVRRLTRLFEAVRYGPREPGEREEAEATDCLRAIVAAYRRRG